ncbi:MAG: BolA family protein [Alphaproteobacteria bacterium]
MARVADRIRSKLEARFQPSVIELVDDSARHAGHAGARVEGETHFNLVIVAAAFAGLDRVARQRLVYQCLAEELAGPVHALAVTARAPGDAPSDAAHRR